MKRNGKKYIQTDVKWKFWKKENFPIQKKRGKNNNNNNNTFESVLMRWMKLEPIIQNEVSQKDKHEYSILMHIYGILKNGNDNPICRTEKETRMYRTDLWTLWEKVRVGGYERIVLKHVYYQVWNRLPAQVGCTRQVLGAGTLGRPRGIGWRERWEGHSGWGTHVIHGWLMSMYGKNHYNIIK